MWTRSVFFSVAILLLPAISDAQSTCGAPATLEDRWQVARPESVGLASATLCPMVKWLDDSKANIHAVLVARRGKLVFEHYFTGADENLGKSAGQVTFGPDVKHDERSVSKSVIGLVIGIAIDRGWIKSINESVFSYFPEYKDLSTPAKDRITLRDLLTMSSGLDWQEMNVPYTSDANSEIKMDFSPDPYRAALSPPLEFPPSVIWNYNSGSTELLGVILRKSTGKPVDQLAQAEIFGPIGIKDFEWYKYPQNGNPIAAAGLRLRPRDLAKLGQLVLQRGAWNGKQIISAKWIAESTTPQIGGLDLNFYGYQFWLGRSLLNRREIDWIAAVGLGGQRVFVVPALDLVVVVNAGMYRSPLQGSIPLDILNRYVLRATLPQS